MSQIVRRPSDIKRLISSTNKWKLDCIEKFKNKFNYDHIQYASSDEKITLNCPEHGEFETTRTLHFVSKAGCTKCSTTSAPINKRYNDFKIKLKTKFPEVEILECNYTTSQKTKVKTFCNICKNEDEWIAMNILSSKTGCHTCAKVLNNKRHFDKQQDETQKWIDRCNLKFNNKFNYSLINPKGVGVDDVITIICPDHGEIETTRYKHENSVTGCKYCGGLHTTNSKDEIKSIVQDKCKSLNIDCNNINFNINIEHKQLFICNDHGEFEQAIHNFINAEQPCPTCRYDKLGDTNSINSSWNLESFIEKCNILHNNKYDYSKIEYKRNYIPVEIICPEHGSFMQLVYNHSGGSGCPSCSKSLTENSIAEWLQSLGVELKQTDRTLIKPQEIDILIESNKLCIEYNGLFYHTVNKTYPTFSKRYHLEKTEKCEELGYQLLHINEDEWVNSIKQDIWKSMIIHRLKIKNNVTKIRANKCMISEISPSLYKSFLNENHLQGNINTKIKIGLFYQNTLVAVLGLGHSRYDKQYEYELYRFAIKKYHNVPRALSTLLKYFEMKYKPKSLLTYADRRYSSGKGYEAIGMSELKSTNIGYKYCDLGTQTTYSRETFQKFKLNDLEYRVRFKIYNYDESKSADYNLLNNGYGILYDCGNKLFVKQYEHKDGEA